MNNIVQNRWEKVVELFCGRWEGLGKGYFPTIDPFDYRETFSVEQRDGETLFYDQRTDKRPLGSDQYETSHWESGFIRLLPDGSLEMTNAQSGGRSEVMAGELITADSHQLSFRSTALTNDGRMIATTRLFTLSGDTLTYQMSMHTTTVDQILPHLEATLHRTPQPNRNTENNHA